MGISFRRLAVYDIEGGRQPIWNEDRTIGLVVNGTVYNHSELRRDLASRHDFRTESDCEPILHLYEEKGSDLVDSLMGMFAFAIWDLNRGRLLLGRDRLGLKPLFWTADDRRLLFASEIKALLAFPDVPRELDWTELLADPCLNNAVSLEPHPLQSGFVGIDQLPGGALLEVDLESGSIDTRQYWDLPDPDPTLTAEEVAESFRDQLFEAIDVCLTGEAAIGMSLSGGVDSAIIAGRAAGRRPIDTFTVISDSTRANGDALGAFEVADFTALRHTQVDCDAERLLSADPHAWQQLLWLCETPLCSPEQLLKFEIFKAARCAVPDLKVMLSGVGGDEFSGGYSTTLAPQPDADWSDFLAGLRRVSGHEARRADPVIGVWDEFLAPGVVNRPQPWDEGRDLYQAFLAFKRRDLLMYNLWCEDRLASAMSIEARAPYLDHRLVELLAAVPAEARPSLLWDKRVIREAGSAVLSPALLARPKVPFFHGPGVKTVYEPFRQLFARDGHALLEMALSEGRAGEYVDLDRVIRTVDGLDGRGAGLAVGIEMVLRLVNMGLLESMARREFDTVPERTASPYLTVDRSSEGSVGEARMAAKPGVRSLDDAVLCLVEDAMLVASEELEPKFFLSLRGQMLFEVAAEDPWLGVLRGFDGLRPLGQLAVEAGTTVDEIASYVDLALDHGLLSEAAVSTPEMLKGGV